MPKMGLGRVPLSVAGVMGLLALVAGIGFFGPDRAFEDDAVSAPPRIASLSPAPTPFTPSPRPLRSPTPAPTLAPGAIFVGSVQRAEWSPSGAQVAVMTRETMGGGETRSFVRVLDRFGRPIDRFQADDFRWLSASSYIAEVVERDGDEWVSCAFVGWVGNVRREIIPDNVLIGDVGPGPRIALLRSDMSRTEDSFYVWSPGALLGPQPGSPVGFSPDGSLVAVAVGPAGWSERAGTGIGSVVGSLELRDTDTGRIVARAGARLPMNLGVAFSPDGKYLAFQTKPDEGEMPGGIGVLDIASDRLWMSPARSVVELRWMDASHLRLWSMQPGGTRLPGGAPVEIEILAYPPDASMAFGSAPSSRGWTATWDDRASVVNVEKDGKTTRVSLGGLIRTAIWSPEGSDLLVVWGSTVVVPADGVMPYESGQFVSIVRP